MAKFEEVMKVNVNEKTEKKGNLTYLSWAWAWAEFKKLYPDATYEVKKFDGLPYVHDKETGYMVYTSVTADGLTYEMWLPVMDARNKTLMNATMFDINKTIMRCLAKNLAMFGLGLYIYAGEDLPEDEQTAKPPAGGAKGAAPNEETKKARKPAQSVKDALIEAQETEIVLKGTQYKLGALPKVTLEYLAEKSKSEEIREAAGLVLREKLKDEIFETDEPLPWEVEDDQGSDT